ncbi:MAG: AAA family ATPase [Puniceicoccales bacterium]|jgi:general secretion pathway protein A|nr:AAA family ATPase [Puniceicoccales bacterium]
MYLSFFGFSEKPFTIKPNKHLLFLGSPHVSALSLLCYGVENNDGFTVIVGEVGCGKTTLCQALLDQLDAKKYFPIYLPIPPQTEEELLASFISTFDIQEVSSGNIVETRKGIKQKLTYYNRQRKRVLLIVDEAQNLSNAMLENIRLLSNIEINGNRAMHIILLGQPELKQHLRQRCMRQLRQRISVFQELRPLNARETRHYIQHHLSLVQTEHISLFTYWAMHKIFSLSKGVPRIINNICDKSLISAYVRNSYKVKRRDVVRAFQEIQQIEES